MWTKSFWRTSRSWIVVFERNLSKEYSELESWILKEISTKNIRSLNPVRHRILDMKVKFLKNIQILNRGFWKKFYQRACGWMKIFWRISSSWIVDCKIIYSEGHPDLESWILKKISRRTSRHWTENFEWNFSKWIVDLKENVVKNI